MVRVGVRVMIMERYGWEWEGCVGVERDWGRTQRFKNVGGKGAGDMRGSAQSADEKGRSRVGSMRKKVLAMTSQPH